MAHDVFISYSSKDKKVADAVCAALESVKIRCWVAPRDVLAGEIWQEAIANAIEKSHIMVLIFSSNSNNSKDVSKDQARDISSVGTKMQYLPSFFFFLSC